MHSLLATDGVELDHYMHTSGGSATRCICEFHAKLSPAALEFLSTPAYASSTEMAQQKIKLVCRVDKIHLDCLIGLTDFHMAL